MPGAVIAIDQDRPGGTSFGTPGVARKDLWRDQVVRPRCSTSGNNSYLWELLDVPPGSATVITSGTETLIACDFHPDSDDSYRLKLTTNGGGPGNVQILVLAVTYDSAGVLVHGGHRLPAFGEQGTENNFDGQSKGWDPAVREILALARDGGGGGGGTGPEGPTGADGAPGAAGAAGSVWRAGTGAPSNGLGVNGDYYLNDANGDVHLKTAGTYAIVANIKGPAGPTGPSGSGIAPDVQTISATGVFTWTRPVGAFKFAIIKVRGAGGGGGGGNGGASGDSYGGSGGGGGAYFERIVTFDELGATETGAVGVGGPGGVTGAIGYAGGFTNFGKWARADGGGPGAGMQSSNTPGSGGGLFAPGTSVTGIGVPAPGGGAVTPGVPGMNFEGAGAPAYAYGLGPGLPAVYGGASGGEVTSPGGISAFGGGGGGAGGIMSAANACTAGGDGGTTGFQPDGAITGRGGAGQGGTSGVPGTAGASPGVAGGGGGPNVAGVGGVGGAGGAGAGGGGGGPGRTGGGAGGAGGNGLVIVTCI